MSQGISRDAFFEVQKMQRDLQAEIVRLKKISERQSAMLAQALKEKNDREDCRNYARERVDIFKNIEQLQGYLKLEQQELQGIKNAARKLIELLGIQ